MVSFVTQYFNLVCPYGVFTLPDPETETNEMAKSSQ